MSLAAVCDALGVQRSAYYAWRSAEPGPRRRELDELAPTVAAIFLKHRRRYGARRIARELRDRYSGPDCRDQKPTSLSYSLAGSFDLPARYTSAGVW
ncbi:MAG: IS3 family transposase [Planctomycetia bacterium]